MDRRGRTRRLFRTVLFTDVVGSTEMAAELGDRRWRQTLARHHAVMRRQLRAHHGTEIDTAGDGFFATFENPSDAVRCAAEAVASVHALGLRIRAAVHTGEVEAAGEKVGGIAVHIGARLLALAGPEEVVVSGTVRDLVAGSGFDFEDRGSHTLKGVPGDWPVYALVLRSLSEEDTATAAEAESGGGARRRRRLMVAAGLSTAMLIAVTVVVVAVLLRPTAATVTRGPDTVAAYRTADGELAAGIRVGRAPDALLADGGILWIANLGGGTLARIDPRNGTADTYGQVGQRPSAIARTGRSVWVADRFEDSISILDAEDGQLTARFELHASAFEAGVDVMWVADDLADVVRRVDVRTNRVTAVIDLPRPSGPSDLVTADAVLWVAASRAGAVLRLDPTAMTVVGAPVAVEGVRKLAAAAGSIWAVSPQADRLTRIEAASGRVMARVDVCDAPVTVVANADGAWVACATERALWQVSPAGEVLRTIALDGVPTDIALDGDRVWLTLRDD